jgi:hypothetical protein
MRNHNSILVLVLALAGAAPATADEIRGVVVRVDLDRHELQIEGRGLGKRGLALSFALGKDTKVEFGREEGTLGELNPGRRVRVSFDVQGGTRRALKVRVVGVRPVPRVERMPAATGKDSLTGVLQRVSYAERELVLVGPGPRGPETETMIAVPRNVRVTQDGKVIPFDELKDGRQAVVRTAQRDGKLVATSIQVGAAVPDEAERSNRLARLRRLLKIADQVLEMAEDLGADRPTPKKPSK